MVEQVRISPEEVRGYGNICEGHTLEDFIVSNSGLAKEKGDVHGALTEVYKLVYSLYGLMFDFDKGNKQLYLQMSEADILSFGFDTVNKQLYLVDLDDTGFNLGFDEDTNELYITDEAPPIISISASNPYLVSGETTDLVVSLVNEFGSPVSGKTVTISDGTSVYSGITNTNGLFTLYDVEVSADTTFTATYSSVSATCTVEKCLFVDYGVTGNHNDTWYRNSGTDNRTVTVNGTTLANTTSTRYDLFAYYGTAVDIYVFQPPYTVELDIVDIVGSGARFQIYDKVTTDNYNGNFSVGHWKIVYDGTTVKPYHNGVEQTNYTRDMPNARVGFFIPQNCSITYKNFRIREG